MPHPEHAVDPDVGPTGGQPMFASLLAAGAREGLMVAVEEPLHRQLGPADDELERIRADARARAEPHRARDVRRDVVRALLVQVLEGAPAHAADRGPGGPRRARARTRARSTSATASRWSSRWSRTRIPARSSRTRARRPASAASCATSSRWARVRWRCWTRCCSGRSTDARNRYLLEGVVAGIGGYGNCIGVPTVGGEIHFARAARREPRVNVMCVGIAPADML